MTANRDLKRRVRDRQAETGESYVTALRQVLAQRPSSLSTAIPTVEFVDVSELAERSGLRCRMSASPTVAHRFDLAATLAQFHEMLLITYPDPVLSLMRAVALRGEQVQLNRVANIDEGAAFVRRVRSGLGGVSENGLMLALRPVLRATKEAVPARAADTAEVAPDESVALFSLWLAPSWLALGARSPGPAAPLRPPLVILTSLGELIHDPLIEAISAARARVRGTP